MISHFRKLIALPLVLLLTFSLSSCDGLAYREAIDLYNAQKYEEAAELFAQLEDYEDSAQMISRCNYWEAVKRMEAGKYAEALPRFLKLGDYEDSPERLLECRYQLAITAFDEESYAQAEQEFLEFADYRQSPEYLRQIRWQKLYNYVLANGNESDGCYTLTLQQDDRTVNLLVDTAVPSTLSFTAVWEKEMGYTFRDDLKISFTRDNFDARFAATSSFTMDFVGTSIGSVQTAEGGFSITTCTADMELTPETFHMTVTDNQGKVTTSENPAEATMFEEMQNNYAAIMAAVPQLVAETGLDITLADIGFENLI